jgi:cobalt/nickel transport system permease protein
METIPTWLAARERYEPRRDRARYLEKSLLSLLGVLAALRERRGEGRGRERLRPELKLVLTFALILAVSLSRSGLFLETSAALELCALCLLPARAIAGILKRALMAALFASLIFLPAFLSGLCPKLFALLAKILLSVLAAALFSATTPWPSVTEAFAALRVPDLFVLTLDLTVKYISLLGGLALNMLYALKLRSVGRNRAKMSSLAGVAGTLFLKSREAAEAQYQAMECRGFAGTYRITRQSGRPSAVPGGKA